MMVIDIFSSRESVTNSYNRFVCKKKKLLDQQLIVYGPTFASLCDILCLFGCSLGSNQFQPSLEFIVDVSMPKNGI